jgi:hypothetical protein
MSNNKEKTTKSETKIFKDAFKAYTGTDYANSFIRGGMFEHTGKDFRAGWYACYDAIIEELTSK